MYVTINQTNKEDIFSKKRAKDNFLNNSCMRNREKQLLDFEFSKNEVWQLFVILLLGRDQTRQTTIAEGLLNNHIC